MNIIKKIKKVIKKILLLDRREKFGIIPKKFIKKVLPPNPIIIEAGAHEGVDTCEMAKVFPDAQIYAFEPVPEIYEKLKDNTKNFPNVHCYQMALGDISGKATLHVSSGASNGSSSLLKPKEHLTDHPNIIFDKDLEVKVMTLKDWAMENGINKVDFFWLDLQGSELDVLKEAGSLVKNAKAIYTEVCTKESYEKQVIYSDLKQWLESLGFKAEREEMAWVHTGNVLFIKK